MFYLIRYDLDHGGVEYGFDIFEEVNKVFFGKGHPVPGVDYSLEYLLVEQLREGVCNAAVVHFVG